MNGIKIILLVIAEILIARHTGNLIIQKQISDLISQKQRQKKNKRKTRRN